MRSFRSPCSYNLPYEQDQLIAELAAANPNLVVVLISGNAVAMPWVAKVPAIVQAWYSGSEAGNALASILSGEVNPFVLPFTFPVRLEDNAATAMNATPVTVKMWNTKRVFLSDTAGTTEAARSLRSSVSGTD